MSTEAGAHSAICLTLTTAISKSRTEQEIYDAALDALSAGLGVNRASILLFDPDGVMRFKASRLLSGGTRPGHPTAPTRSPSSSPTLPLIRRSRATCRRSRPRASPGWRSSR